MRTLIKAQQQVKNLNMTAVSDTNGYKHRKIMKEEILKIAKDLEQCTISEHQARTILLGMCVHDYGCNKKTKTGKCRTYKLK